MCRQFRLEPTEHFCHHHRAVPIKNIVSRYIVIIRVRKLRCIVPVPCHFNQSTIHRMPNDRMTTQSSVHSRASQNRSPLLQFGGDVGYSTFSTSLKFQFLQFGAVVNHSTLSTALKQDLFAQDLFFNTLTHTTFRT